MSPESSKFSPPRQADGVSQLDAEQRDLSLVSEVSLPQGIEPAETGSSLSLTDGIKVLQALASREGEVEPAALEAAIEAGLAEFLTSPEYGKKLGDQGDREARLQDLSRRKALREKLCRDRDRTAEQLRQTERKLGGILGNRWSPEIWKKLRGSGPKAQQEALSSTLDDLNQEIESIGDPTVPIGVLEEDIEKHQTVLDEFVKVDHGFARLSEKGRQVLSSMSKIAAEYEAGSAKGKGRAAGPRELAAADYSDLRSSDLYLEAWEILTVEGVNEAAQYLRSLWPDVSEEDIGKVAGELTAECIEAGFAHRAAGMFSEFYDLLPPDRYLQLCVDLGGLLIDKYTWAMCDDFIAEHRGRLGENLPGLLSRIADVALGKNCGKVAAAILRKYPKQISLSELTMKGLASKSFVKDCLEDDIASLSAELTGSEAKVQVLDLLTRSGANDLTAFFWENQEQLGQSLGETVVKVAELVLDKSGPRDAATLLFAFREHIEQSKYVSLCLQIADKMAEALDCNYKVQRPFILRHRKRCADSGVNLAKFMAEQERVQGRPFEAGVIAGDFSIELDLM